MNTAEHPPSVNAQITNPKVTPPGRAPMAEDSATRGLETSGAADDSAVPQKPAEPGDGGAAAIDEAVESLSDFRSIEEISVDPATNELLVKVPSEQVGRMIGKNGLVIKELQSQSGAFINMAKEGEVYRLARISGNYPETYLCALLLVQKFTPREEIQKHEKLENLIRFCKKNRPVKPFIVENFTVPEEHLGRVIGKGGHTLREIQEQSHAKIDLPKTPVAAAEHHRVLMISGSPDEVAVCRELLKARITPREDGGMAGPDAGAPAPSAAVAIPAGPGAHRDSPRVGRHESPGHETPPRFVQDPLMSRPYYHTPPSYTSYMPYYQQGYDHMYYQYSPYGYMPAYPQYPYNADLAADISRVSISPSAESQDDHQVPHMHPALAAHSPQLHATAPVFVPTIAMQPHQHESVIPIPGELVGRLIGRQGVAVKQLQMETKTRVDILDAEPNAPDTTRYVRITALRPENVRLCEAHIKARVAAHYGSGNFAM